MSPEFWDIPDNYDWLVAGGDAQYSIRGVETQDNMDSMRRFVEAVGIPSDKIEVDDGTQIIVTHPDPTKIIVIDAGGLGDFFDSGFDVAVVAREEAQETVRNAQLRLALGAWVA
jgi:hypothetical protein